LYECAVEVAEWFFENMNPGRSAIASKTAK
jgi:hypothetical protein